MTTSDAAQDLLRAAGGRRFSTILADPPWRFVNRTGKMAPEHRRLSRYGTMTLSEIAALPVGQIAAATSHLYLWVPNALLPEGLQVLRAWGFEYKATSSGTRSARTAARTGAVSAFTFATSRSWCCSACAAATRGRWPRGGAR